MVEAHYELILGYKKQHALARHMLVMALVTWCEVARRWQMLVVTDITAHAERTSLGGRLLRMAPSSISGPIRLVITEIS